MLKKERLMSILKLVDQNEIVTVNDLVETANRLHMLKNLPHHVQMAIATGPIVIFAREINTGLYTLDDATVERVVEACWDAIRC